MSSARGNSLRSDSKSGSQGLLRWLTRLRLNAIPKVRDKRGDALGDDGLASANESDNRREVPPDREEDDRQSSQLVGQDEMLQGSLEGERCLGRKVGAKPGPDKGRESSDPEGPCKRNGGADDDCDAGEDSCEQFFRKQLSGIECGEI